MRGFALISALVLVSCARPPAATYESCRPFTDSGGPDVQIVSPTPYRVVQRDLHDTGRIPVQAISATRACIEARVTTDTSASLWRMVRGGVLDEVPAGGWYTLEVRAVLDGQAGTIARVAPIGVGEVFVVAGQSNAAFWGSIRQATATGQVAFFDGETWSLCRDPVLIAGGGEGGSPWCLLGDRLNEAWRVPIAFVPTAVGSASVQTWQRGGPPFARLADRLRALGPHGVRAVLWHQGEADSAEGTASETYAAQMKALIDASRAVAGYPVPWFVSEVSVHAGTSPPLAAAIVQGQRAVVDRSRLVFSGVQTDDLVGEAFRSDGVHFSEAGLQEHARRWAVVLQRDTP